MHYMNNGFSNNHDTKLEVFPSSTWQSRIIIDIKTYYDQAYENMICGRHKLHPNIYCGFFVCLNIAYCMLEACII